MDLPVAVTQARRVLRRRLAWHRRPLAAACVALTVLAGFAEVRALRRGVDAVVAARDLPAGAVLTAHDLTTVTLPAQSLADGAVPTVADAVGERLVLPMRRNEPVTGVRLVSGGLLQALGHGLRAVPVRLADAALAEVLQAGSVVDVYARNEGGASLGAVATAVTILRLLPADDQGVVVLIAADDATAARLTSAAGGGALSVALRAPP